MAKVKGSLVRGVVNAPLVVEGKPSEAEALKDLSILS